MLAAVEHDRDDAMPQGPEWDQALLVGSAAGKDSPMDHQQSNDHHVSHRITSFVLSNGWRQRDIPAEPALIRIRPYRVADVEVSRPRV